MLSDDHVLGISGAWNFDMYINYDTDPLTIAGMNVFVVRNGKKAVRYNASSDVIANCSLTSER